MPRRAFVVLVVSFLLASLRGAAVAEHAAGKQSAAPRSVGADATSSDRPAGSGEALYRRYCASCHAVDGRGDGTVASVLRTPPPDLTRLEYGEAELMKQIDGRRTIGAHGTAAMPVWGEVFEQALIAEPHRRRTTLQRVQAIADYVLRLRAPSPAASPLPRR